MKNASKKVCIFPSYHEMQNGTETSGCQVHAPAPCTRASAHPVSRLLALQSFWHYVCKISTLAFSCHMVAWKPQRCASFIYICTQSAHLCSNCCRQCQLGPPWEEGRVWRKKKRKREIATIYQVKETEQSGWWVRRGGGGGGLGLH